ncbi:MAG: S-layer homology domain-containing protein [Firmicutes bacterium]|nr:S-layer homology domain-containing protein [Bacillota bacterium]
MMRRYTKLFSIILAAALALGLAQLSVYGQERSWEESLAYGKPVSIMQGGVHSSGPVKNLTDGDENTFLRLNTNAIGLDRWTWVSVDLGSVQNVNCFKIHTHRVYTASPHSYIQAIRIEGSVSGIEFDTIIPDSTPDGAEAYPYNYTLEFSGTETSARYIRLWIRLIDSDLDVNGQSVVPALKEFGVYNWNSGEANNELAVRLVSPTNGAFYSRYVPFDGHNTNVSVIVTAEVTGASGIARVDFYNCGEPMLGTVTQTMNHYSITMDNPDLPVNYITAKAVDDTGLEAVSEPVAFYTNIALNKPVTASDKGYDADSNPESVVDGIMHLDTLAANKWYIRNTALATLEIDFEEVFTLAGTKIHSGRTGNDAGILRNFKIEYDNNGQWTDIPGAAVTDNTDKNITVVFAQPVSTHRIRYSLIDAGNDASTEYRIREIEVFGAPKSKPNINILSMADGETLDLKGDVGIEVEIGVEDSTIAKVEVYVNGALAQTLPGAGAFNLYKFNLTNVQYGLIRFDVRVLSSSGTFAAKSLTINNFPFDFMTKINAAGNIDAIYSALRKYGDLLTGAGFHTGQYILLPDMEREGVCDALLGKENYSHDANGLSALTNDFNKMVLLSSVNTANNAEALRQAIEKCGDLLDSIDISTDSDFDKLEYAIKQAVFEKLYRYRTSLTGGVFTDFSDIEGVFEKFTVLCAISKSYWGQLDSLFIQYNNLLNLPLSGDYAQKLDAEGRAEVCRGFANVVFNEYDELKTFFENKVSIALAARSSRGNGNSGGGGTSTVSSGIPNALPLIPQAVPGTGTKGAGIAFSDLHGVEWAIESIEELVALNIVEGFGNGKFGPDEMVTREQFIKMLVLALELADEGAQSTFSDTFRDDWHYIYIASAQNAGISNGMGDGSFGVGRQIIRQEMVALAYRACQAVGLRLIQVNPPIEFEDNNEISGYAKQSVAEMQKAGIISGIGGGRFAPNETSTRAQASNIVYGILRLRGNK